jgi:hypothetical protein
LQKQITEQQEAYKMLYESNVLLSNELTRENEIIDP